MHYEKFIIKNYQAIENLELRLDSNLIPIIGLNESGKTTILRALTAFHRRNDEEHAQFLNSENFYNTQVKEGSVSAAISFDSLEEAQAIFLSSQQRDSTFAEWYTAYHRLAKYGGTFTLTRHFPRGTYTISFNTEKQEERQYSIENPNTEEYVFGPLLRNLPSIIYFESFTQNVPITIRFERIWNLNELTKSVGEPPYWANVLTEVFRSAKHDLPEFLEKSEQERNKDTRERYTHEEIREVVERHLNEAIADKWLWLLEGGSSNKPRYQVRLFYERERLSKTESDEIMFAHDFDIRLFDSHDPNQSTGFNLNERSKGFLWFANFVLQVVFNPDYARNYGNALLLLDEPGAYLHSAAQERLLDILIDISKSYSIIYATHLPQLLDPKISIFNCRVAHRDGWRIKLTKYGEYSAENKTENMIGPLTTLWQALQLKLSAFIHPQPVSSFVITEGIYDFYALSMVKKYTDIFREVNFDPIPGSGVDQLENLISLAIAWSDPYVVIFDNDEQGTKAMNDYKDIFGEEQARYWFQLENQAQDKVVAIEKLFSTADWERIQQLTGTKGKKAWAALYFREESEVQEFWKTIDEETKSNWNWVSFQIAKILTPEPPISEN